MAAHLQLPPGFRFHPTDEELVMYFLCRKCASHPISVPVIAEIDLYKFSPWDLPGLALYGEKEWYFFSPRDRKYPNGSRPNRTAGAGYWKATGADKPIGRPKPVGIKKSLVFYAGKAPQGEKTNWIMHEYRLADVDRSAHKKNNNPRLDDWVLCRIYNKKGTIEKPQDNSPEVSNHSLSEEKKPEVPSQLPQAVFDDSVNLQGLNSLARAEGELNSSEQVYSPEVTKLDEWEKAALDYPFSYMDATMGNSVFGSQFQGDYQMMP